MARLVRQTGGCGSGGYEAVYIQRGIGRLVRRVRLAPWSVFCLSCFLTLLVSEEICGRFGSFRRRNRLHIGLLREVSVVGIDR